MTLCEDDLSWQDKIFCPLHRAKTTSYGVLYRQMRSRYHVLMDGDKPVGGKWNLDAENRKSIPEVSCHQSPRFAADEITSEVKAMVAISSRKTWVTP